MYSDISKRMMLLSEPNISPANALANSVLPTPVGPRNINEPIGRFGSLMPDRARRTARATLLTASSCPLTRLCKWSSRLISCWFSVWVSCCIGTPVHIATISATFWLSISISNGSS